MASPGKKAEQAVVTAWLAKEAHVEPASAARYADLLARDGRCTLGDIKQLTKKGLNGELIKYVVGNLFDLDLIVSAAKQLPDVVDGANPPARTRLVSAAPPAAARGRHVECPWPNQNRPLARRVDCRGAGRGAGALWRGARDD